MKEHRLLDLIKILSNVVDVNNFDSIDTLHIYAGSYPVKFYLRLWQSDRGMRYMPDSNVNVKVEFMRSDTVGQTNTTQTITKYLTQPFSEDPSIFYVDLAEDDVSKITTGGFRITVTEGSGATEKTTVLYSSMTIRKRPSSDDIDCCE